MQPARPYRSPEHAKVLPSGILIDSFLIASPAMSHSKESGACWAFQTLMVAACLAAVGAVACLLGNSIESHVLCTVGRAHVYAGEAMGAFAMAAGILTLGWWIAQ